MALVSLAGCVAQINLEGPLDEERLTEILLERGVEPKRVVVPFQLNDAMRAWAHETAPQAFTAENRLERLRIRLLTAEELPLEYTWGYTGTAIEVFEQRQANCLAFTNLFVGMAREVGVPVFFLAVEDLSTYRKEGDLVVISDHIAVGFNTQNTVKMYDFSEHGGQSFDAVRQISDLTAVAMFYSNRGAEALQQGRVSEALEWLRQSVVLAPEKANHWVNLGVALRRNGEQERAELAYKGALEIDPRITSAYQNLISLLRFQGREAEAAGFEQTLRRAPNRNPFTYLSLGDVSRQNGRLDEARRFYRRAARLAGENEECYAALGQLAFATGDLRTARKMLRKAQNVNDGATAHERTRQLEGLLAGGVGG